MNDGNLLCHMTRFIGETVTVFTTSGGPSGCGFTGVLLAVNPCFIRLMTKMGTAPTNPLSRTICPRDEDDRMEQRFTVGSVCDIPVIAIAAFCHNAI